MLLAPSKLMNPNWQGLRCGERPNCPVKQVFHATLTGNGGFSAGAEALTWSQCGQYYKLSSHSSYAASTLTVDTGKSHCSHTHTLSDCKPRVSHSHPVAFWDWIAWMSLGFSAHSRGLSFMETRNMGTTSFCFFGFFCSCLEKWECVWGWGSHHWHRSGLWPEQTWEAWPSLRDLWPSPSGRQWSHSPLSLPPHWSLADPGRTHCFSQKAPGLGNVCI